MVGLASKEQLEVLCLSLGGRGELELPRARNQSLRPPSQKKERKKNANTL